MNPLNSVPPIETLTKIAKRSPTMIYSRYLKETDSIVDKRAEGLAGGSCNFLTSLVYVC